MNLLSRHILYSITGKKGFTLIELLVVIGILGILAAGLLAAIDPLEQLRKGQDTAKQKIAVEYNGALTRYYATYSQMPWGTGTPPNALALNVAPATGGGGYTESLITRGELKSTFEQAVGTTNLGQLYLTGLATGDVFVCFDPVSKSMSLSPTTLYTTSSGGTTATCPTTNPSTVCYFCAR